MEQILADPSNLTFGVLFVTLLGYVIKNNEKTVADLNNTNKEREDRYTMTIRELTSALNDNEALKQSIANIEKKVNA